MNYSYKPINEHYSSCLSHFTLGLYQYRRQKMPLSAKSNSASSTFSSLLRAAEPQLNTNIAVPLPLKFPSLKLTPLNCSSWFKSNHSELTEKQTMAKFKNLRAPCLGAGQLIANGGWQLKRFVSVHGHLNWTRSIRSQDNVQEWCTEIKTHTYTDRRLNQEFLMTNCVPLWDNYMGLQL